MTTKRLLHTICIALLAATWLPGPEARAQNTYSSAPTPMEMVAVGANGNERRVRSLEGIMAPVGLPVGGQIALTLKASTGKAGQRISLRLLDGGEIVVDPAISMAGQLHLQGRRHARAVSG